MLRTLPAVSLFLAAPLSAQGFQYPDFSNAAGLAFNGDAAVVGNELRVTPSAASQVGSVWFDTPLDLSGGFETTFTFRIGNDVFGGADGMAFVIQDDPAGTAAIADLGSAMGYSGGLTDLTPGLDRSLVLEIDTYQAGSWGDPSANHLSLHTGGMGDNSALEDYSLGQHTPTGSLSDGLVQTVRVTYFPGQLDVYLNDLSTPVISVPYSLSSGGTYLNGSSVDGLGLTGGLAYVGFTAATGGAYEDHDVLSWELLQGGLGENYCVAAPNSVGAGAIISAGGSLSVSANNLRLVASPVPDQPGLFYYGPAQLLLPFGNGFRCIGGFVGRLPIENASGGSLEHQLDNTLPPSAPVTITPGSTWNFQAWYRDPADGGASFNLSNGLQLVFVP